MDFSTMQSGTGQGRIAVCGRQEAGAVEEVMVGQFRVEVFGDGVGVGGVGGVGVMPISVMCGREMVVGVGSNVL